MAGLLAVYHPPIIIGTDSRRRVIQAIGWCQHKDQRQEGLWRNRLVRMMQTGLMTLFKRGAAVRMAYYDLFVILVFLLPQITDPLLATVAAKEKTAARTPNPP